MKPRASWVSTFGAVASIVAAAVSGVLAWKGATETAEINTQGAIQTAKINKAGAEEVARIQNEGAVDNKMIDWAMIIMQKPDATVPERVWALDILSTWKKVPMTPERRKEIAESRKPLSEAGKFSAEAKSLNEKLDAVPFWRDLVGNFSKSQMDVQPTPEVDEGSPELQEPKANRLPADGKGNRIELQKQN